MPGMIAIRQSVCHFFALSVDEFDYRRDSNDNGKRLQTKAEKKSLLGTGG
jgi:hypothetical protein